MTKVGLYAIGKSTILESNKSLARLLRSTPYVLITRLTGDVRTAASTCAVVP